MSINLLPDELKPKSGSIAASKSLKKASIIFLSIFLLTAFAIGGAIIVTTNLAKIQSKKNDTLSGNIKSLEQTETQLVLIRDRLTKIRQIQGNFNTKDYITSLKTLLESYDDEVKFSEAKIDADGITLVAVFQFPRQLSSFLDAVYNKSSYENIKLNSLKYLTGSGYEVSLTLNPT